MLFCYWRQYHVERLRYRFGTHWKLLVGLENWGVAHSYTEYPQRFVQRISTLTPSLAVEIPAGRFTLVPGVGYAMDYNAYSEVTTEKIPLSANSSTTISRQREKTVQALFYEKTPVLQHCAAGITDFNLEILQISRCTTDRQQKMTEIFLFPS